MYIPGGFTSSYVLDTYGSHKSLWIGAVLTALGAVIRYIGCFINAPTVSLVLAFIGQIIAGFGQPFLLNAPTKITFEWFLESQRALFNVLMTAGSALGSLLAFILSAVIVSSSKDIPTLLLTITIFCVVAFILTVLFIPLSGKPTTSEPSPDVSALNLKQSLKKSKLVSYYYILLFAAAIAIGLFNTIGTLLTQFLEPFGYGNTESSIIGALFILVGILSGFLAGFYIDKSYFHLELMKIMYPVSTVLFIAGAIVIPTTNLLYLVAVVVIGTGGCIFSMQPAVFELSASIVRDVGIGEGFSSGMIWMTAQIFGVVFISVFDACMRTWGNAVGAKISLWGMVGLMIIGTIIIAVYPKGKNMRRNLEVDEERELPTSPSNKNKFIHEEVALWKERQQNLPHSTSSKPQKSVADILASNRRNLVVQQPPQHLFEVVNSSQRPYATLPRRGFQTPKSWIEQKTHVSSLTLSVLQSYHRSRVPSLFLLSANNIAKNVSLHYEILPELPSIVKELILLFLSYPLEYFTFNEITDELPIVQRKSIPRKPLPSSYLSLFKDENLSKFILQRPVENFSEVVNFFSNSHSTSEIEAESWEEVEETDFRVVSGTLSIESIDFSNNEIPFATLGAIFSLQISGSLKYLSLGNFRCSADGTALIKLCTQLVSLEYLDLKLNEWVLEDDLLRLNWGGDNGVGFVVWRLLRVLELNGCVNCNGQWVELSVKKWRPFLEIFY
ncbi:Major facilitator super domain-containing protein 7 [Nowakowskiella sp. JEL0407]|nr:Major facilitator super domain-containing protein 7 [Nowakowskiella sp. JEL0407]